MTDLQNQLIGDLLRGEAVVTIKGKEKRQSFEIAFDDATVLTGPRVVGTRGKYGESFARDGFFEAVRLGQGEEAARSLHEEFKARGTLSGASQAWIVAYNECVQSR